MKIIIAVVFISALLNGCTFTSSNNEEAFNVLVDDFKEANLITYNAITKETFNDKNLNTNSCANIILNRNPHYQNSISISNGSNDTYFTRSNQEYTAEKSFRISKYYGAINEHDYKIDDSSRIILTKEYENFISLNMLPFEEMSEQTLQSDDPFYIIQKFEVAMPEAFKQMSDPFCILIYLIEQNLPSFKLENGSDTNETVYNGHIISDTIVDYYMNDGADVFKDLLYPDYRGEMTREALANETSINQYNTLVEPLNALLFTEELIPIKITKKNNENTYNITINMTAAKNALYETMYAGKESLYTAEEGFYVVDESLLEYKNIILNQ